MFVSNSRKSHRGGGVGVYIKNIHNFSVVEELTIMNEKIFESIFIKIDIQNIDVLCENIYKSPSNNIHSNEVFINTLHNCLEEDYVGKRMMEMAVPGRRKRGRPRRRWMDLVREDMERVGAREGDEVDRVKWRLLSRCGDPE